MRINEQGPSVKVLMFVKLRRDKNVRRDQGVE